MRNAMPILVFLSFLLAIGMLENWHKPIIKAFHREEKKEEKKGEDYLQSALELIARDKKISLEEAKRLVLSFHQKKKEDKSSSLRKLKGEIKTLEGKVKALQKQ